METSLKKFFFVLLAMIMFMPVAEAKKYHKKRHYKGEDNFISSLFNNLGPRPAKWCGYWMRTQFGGGPEYNVARNWARRGSSANAQVGAVVVWPHHVGIITGRAANGQFIVKSGNDSNRVRERPRSVVGAIAFRML